MGTTTGIEWTDHTFNPWIGCTKVSAGCANCYAKTRDDRHLLGPVSHWGPGAPRHITSASNWKQPSAWARAARQARTRAKVFCASQADIFEAEAPVKARKDLWTLIGDTCDALDWQLLTKRPENIIPVMCDDGLNLGFFEVTHCWLGTSVENQAAAYERIPLLLETPAAVRFVSCEPLLGPLDIQQWIGIECRHESSYCEHDTGALICRECEEEALLDWVIVGGESGPHARPMHPDWARSLRDQCVTAGVPYFFKQWGEYAAIDSPIGNEVDVVRGERQCVQLDGTHFNRIFLEEIPATVQWMERVGKKLAGCLLDGCEWRQFPEVAHAV